MKIVQEVPERRVSNQNQIFTDINFLFFKQSVTIVMANLEK